MNGLTLNGTKVVTPTSNCKVYKARPCSLLLYVTPENFDSALEEYRKEGFSGPYQGLYLKDLSDYSFLEEFPLMRYLEISSPKPIPTNSIHRLRNLRGLKFTKQKEGLEFCNFPQLEYFVGEWHEQNTGIDRCPILKELHLTKLKSESRNLKPLENIGRLEHLSIAQGNIESLNGIETLKDLLTLDLCYLPKLKSIDALSALSETLREIEFQNLPNITTYDCLGDLKNLRKLIVSKTASMDNLRWAKNLSRLQFFSFVETLVEDGNLKPLLELESLSYVGLNDRKSYNMSMEDVNLALNKNT